MRYPCFGMDGAVKCKEVIKSRTETAIHGHHSRMPQLPTDPPKDHAQIDIEPRNRRLPLGSGRNRWLDSFLEPLIMELLMRWW